MVDLTRFQHDIQATCPGIEIRFNEPMSRHTSFRIGGPVEVMAFPKDKEELSLLLKEAFQQGITPRILGAGTNILAPDDGMLGLVICLKDCFGGMERLGDYHIRIAAGVTMTRAAIFAANHGLSGLEFAHGIPGTIGGGVYMNAGAYGGEISQICTSVEIMNFDGTIERIPNAKMGFSYRHSMLQERQAIVLSADFRVEHKDSREIKEFMQNLQARRSASQPLDLPSAGSAFKRPSKGYAAALIEELGLKGYQVGRAAISTKHAGFAVNLGGATSEDMQTLLEQVSDTVYQRTGILLEPEIRIW